MFISFIIKRCHSADIWSFTQQKHSLLCWDTKNVALLQHHLETVTQKELYEWIVATKAFLARPATNWDAAMILMI